MGLINTYGGSLGQAQYVESPTLGACKPDYEQLIKNSRDNARKIRDVEGVLLENMDIIYYDGAITFAELIGRLRMALLEQAKRETYFLAELEKEVDR